MPDRPKWTTAEVLTYGVLIAFSAVAVFVCPPLLPACFGAWAAWIVYRVRRSRD